MAHAEPVGNSAFAGDGHVEGSPDAHSHPSEWVYIKIAAMLLAITIVEVVIYYIQWVHDKGLLVPALLGLSVIKFGTVVAFFMHLKFDDKRLAYIFGGGLFIAVSIVLALDVLLKVAHPIDYAKGMLH